MEHMCFGCEFSNRIWQQTQVDSSFFSSRHCLLLDWFLEWMMAAPDDDIIITVSEVGNLDAMESSFIRGVFDLGGRGTLALFHEMADSLSTDRRYATHGIRKFHNGQHAVSTHTNIERTSFSLPNQMDFGQITMVHGRCHSGVVSLEYKGYHDTLNRLHNTMV